LNSSLDKSKDEKHDNKKYYRQQRFCEIAKYVLNSHLSFARNFILAENLGSEVRNLAKPQNVVSNTIAERKRSKFMVFALTF
jgi:hypothetical protein